MITLSNIDCTSFFSSYDFKKNYGIILSYLKKINKLNSTEIPKSDQTKLRLNEINKIIYYFNSDIQERKIMSKKISKYIAAFDYIDKTLIVLSATSGGIKIISFTNVI